MRHPVHTRREHVTRCVATENGDVSFSQPLDAARMESGGAFFFHIPGADLGPAQPAARSDQHDIAAADLKARPLLPCLEIFRVDRCARFEVLQLPQPGNVHENATSEDAVFQVANAELGGAGARDGLSREAVEDFSVVEDVTQSVDVGVCIAVVGDAVVVSAPLARGFCSRQQHLVPEGTAVVGGLLSLGIAR